MPQSPCDNMTRHIILSYKGKQGGKSVTCPCLPNRFLNTLPQQLDHYTLKVAGPISNGMHFTCPPTHFLPSPRVWDESHLGEISHSCGKSECPFPNSMPYEPPLAPKVCPSGLVGNLVITTTITLAHNAYKTALYIPHSTTSKPGWDQIAVAAFSVLQQQLDDHKKDLSPTATTHLYSESAEQSGSFNTQLPLSYSIHTDL